MADPTRPLTLSDLWLPGDVLGGAMLGGWTGPALVKSIITDNDGNDVWEGGICAGGHASNGFRGRDECRLDFTRPEVRDRAARVLGPDLLPIHAAELRGEITPSEAAGLVWCSVLRREAGIEASVGWVDSWSSLGDGDNGPGTAKLSGFARRGFDVMLGVGWCYYGRHNYRKGWLLRVDDQCTCSGPEVGGAGRTAADAAALAAGYALREPGGVLLLPLPDGTVGRLETSNG